MGAMEPRSSRLNRSFGKRRWRLAVFAGALLLNLGFLGGLALRDVRESGGGARIATPYVLYADITPRPGLRRLDRDSEARSEEAPGLPDEDEDARVFPGPTGPGGPSMAAAADVDDMWRVSPPVMEDRIARALRAGAMGCANRNLLSAAEREACDQRVRAAAPYIAGTGDRRRDERFARQGARELAAWEERRAAPPARTPCEQDGPISDCGVEINVEIFSTIDGFLPNLRRDD